MVIKASFINPNAGKIVSGPTAEEIEFKAAFFHALWVDRKKRAGKHYPDFHSNPMLTPPPLRGDGKTRCDDCCLLMAPYPQLPDAQKAAARDIAANIPEAEKAWRNRG